MDFRRAKEAYEELLEFDPRTGTDFQREADMMELDFEEDSNKLNWEHTMFDLFGFLDLDPEDPHLEDQLRDAIVQGLSFNEFVNEVITEESMAA